MSRSWKHHPIIKKQDRYFKRLANRVARRVFDIGESESRRHQFGWSICDQRWVNRGGEWGDCLEARKWYQK